MFSAGWGRKLSFEAADPWRHAVFISHVSFAHAQLSFLTVRLMSVIWAGVVSSTGVVGCRQTVEQKRFSCIHNVL
jgi:hypothetical protein